MGTSKESCSVCTMLLTPFFDISGIASKDNGKMVSISDIYM